jgi:hypothetical protein
MVQKTHFFLILERKKQTQEPAKRTKKKKEVCVCVWWSFYFGRAARARGHPPIDATTNSRGQRSGKLAV